MSRFGFGFVMLTAFLAAGGFSGYVVETATSADAPAAASVRVYTVYECDGPFTIVNGVPVPFGQQPPVPPTPDPVPDPVPPVSDLSKAIVAEINKISPSDARHMAAVKLGTVYEAVGGEKVPPAKAVEVAVKGVTLMLTTAEMTMMAPVVSLVNAALTKCTTEADVSAVFLEAGTACVSTVPNSESALAQMGTKLQAGETDELKALGERYGIDWSAFMQMMMQFLTVILPLILQLLKTTAFIGQFVVLV